MSLRIGYALRHAWAKPEPRLGSLRHGESRYFTLLNLVNFRHSTERVMVDKCPSPSNCQFSDAHGMLLRVTYWESLSSIRRVTPPEVKEIAVHHSRPAATPRENQRHS